MLLQNLIEQFNDELQMQRLRPKRTRRYSREFKLKCIELLENGVDINVLAEKTDLLPATIKTWKKHKKQLTEKAAKKTTAFNTLKVTGARHNPSLLEADTPPSDMLGVLTIEAPGGYRIILSKSTSFRAASGVEAPSHIDKVF